MGKMDKPSRLEMLVTALRAILLHRGPGYRCLNRLAAVRISSPCAVFPRNVEVLKAYNRKSVMDRAEQNTAKQATE